MDSVYVIPSLIKLINNKKIIFQYDFYTREKGFKLIFGRKMRKFLIPLDTILMAAVKFNANIEGNKIIIKEENTANEFQKFIGYNNFESFNYK